LQQYRSGAKGAEVVVSWVLAMVYIRRVSSLYFGSQHPEDDQDMSKHVGVSTNCV